MGPMGQSTRVPVMFYDVLVAFLAEAMVFGRVISLDGRWNYDLDTMGHGAGHAMSFYQP